MRRRSFARQVTGFLRDWSLPRQLAGAGHCHLAVHALNRVLDEKPAEEHEYLLEAVRCLVRLRDRLIERRRTGHPSPELQDRLDRTNAILSVVVGGQYPLVGVR